MLSQLRVTHPYESRSISAENITGEKGKGGMATDSPWAFLARDLGQGWKVSPFLKLEPGQTLTIADIHGSGIIKHIWMTHDSRKNRRVIFRIYWDDSDTPSVEVPLFDFFASANDQDFTTISSLAVCANGKRAFNCYWEMPFFKRCRMTVESLDDRPLLFAYQVDYAIGEIPENSAYFHAQFRRVERLKYKDVYTVLDNVQGNGQYVGTYVYWHTRIQHWWGEGEIKFFLDGDQEFPTICGTGTEDYFCGAWCFDHITYSTPYAGLISEKTDEKTGDRRYSMYRWHITDPIYFKKDIRITLQALGLKDSSTYLPLEDDISSVSYWYQDTICKTFPPLPSAEELETE